MTHRRSLLFVLAFFVFLLIGQAGSQRPAAAFGDLNAPFFTDTGGAGYSKTTALVRHLVLTESQQWRSDMGPYGVAPGANVSYSFRFDTYTDDNALVVIIWRAGGREVGRSAAALLFSQQHNYTVAGTAPAGADSYILRFAANTEGTPRTAPLDLYMQSAAKAGAVPEWGAITNLWPSSSFVATINENATALTVGGGSNAAISQQTFVAAGAGQIFSYRVRLTTQSSNNGYLAVYFLNGNGQEISRAVDWFATDKMDYVLTGVTPPNTATLAYGYVINTGATHAIGPFDVTIDAVAWERGMPGSLIGVFLTGSTQTPTPGCGYNIQGNIYPARSIFSPHSSHQMGADWALFYSGWDGAVSGGKRCFNDRIYKATSKDGRTWTKAANAIVAPGADGTWDCKHVSDPDVVAMPDGRYFLYYTGYNDGICAPGLPARDQIGLAISSDGGNTFVKYGGNPILGPGDPTVNQNPQVQRIGNTFYMWLTHTYDKEYTYRWQSSDGVHWGNKTRVTDAGLGMSIVYPDIEQEADGSWLMYYIAAPANMTPAYRGSLQRAVGVNVGTALEAWIPDTYFNVPHKGMFDYFDLGGSMQATGRIATPRRQIIYAAGNHVDNSVLYITDAPDRI